jgi:hypothetical protein
MPVKKYKPTAKNTGEGDVVILSSTSHYTARGLVEKQTVSKHGSTGNTASPEKSPLKSPQKPTHGLTPDVGIHGGFDFDQGMLEPLKLPQSKVGLVFFHHTILEKSPYIVLSQLFTQSQNDYMREYLEKRNFCVARIIASEGGSPDRLCIRCETLGDWRCVDCLGQPSYCMTCCRYNHANTPFHQVQH